MLNALWLNAQELNGSGQLNRVIALSASASAGASTIAPNLVRQRGLRSSSTCGATTAVDAFRRRSLTAAVSAGAVANEDTRLSPTRMLGGSGFVLTFGLLGASFAREMSATVTAGASAVMYPYDALLEGDVQAGASVVAPVLTRIRQMHGAGTGGAIATPPASVTERRAFGSVSAGARAIGSPDTIVGGVRHAEFGANVVVGAGGDCTIDPRKFLHGSTTITTTAYAAPVVNRIVDLAPVPALALASAAFPMLQAIVNIRAAAVSAGAAAQSSLYRTAMVAATVATGATALRPRLRAERYISAAPVKVSASAATVGLDHYRGLSANAAAGATASGGMAFAQKLYAVGFVRTDVAPAAIKTAQKFAGSALCGISAVAAVDVKLAIKLSADVEAGATAEAPGYFTIRTLGGDGTIETRADGFAIRIRSMAAQPVAGAQAAATVWINLYDWEPDFRTLQVDPEDWIDSVSAEDWTLTITDDGQGMKTFTKQPREVLAYDIDFMPWFEQIPRDDIESATCVVTSATSGDPTDLTVQRTVLMADGNNPPGPTTPAHRVKVWLSGGNDGVTYHLTLTIDTEDGRRKEVDFKLKVKEI